jgi:uncharacterized protein with FMN-binding domain
MDTKYGSGFKRLALTLFVLLSFIGYSFHQRDEGKSANNKVLAPKPNNQATAQTAAPASTAGSVYKDGTYNGEVADAFYGNIQVKAIISGGKITDVQFLQYPHDNPNSISINEQAMPFLKQEAIHAQRGRVDIVSGATDTSSAFSQSLSSALNQAH